MKMKQSIQSIDIMEKTFSDIENYHNSCLVSLSLGKQKTERMSGMFTIQKHDRITWTNIPWWLPIGKSMCGSTGYRSNSKTYKVGVYGVVKVTDFVEEILFSLSLLFIVQCLVSCLLLFHSLAIGSNGCIPGQAEDGET